MLLQMLRGNMALHCAHRGIIVFSLEPDFIRMGTKRPQESFSIDNDSSMNVRDREDNNFHKFIFLIL